MVAAALAIRALSLPSISSSSNNKKQKLLHNNTYDEREELRYNDNSQLRIITMTKSKQMNDDKQILSQSYR
jgi:hypothetical protein